MKKMSKEQQSGGFRCHLCQKTFASKDSMERHKNSIHLRLKQMCSVCVKEFSNKDSLKRHVNDVQEERKKFKCPDCPLTFARSDNCYRHVTVRSDPLLNFCNCPC